MAKLIVGVLSIIVVGVFLYAIVRIIYEIIMWALPVIIIGAILLGVLCVIELKNGK